MRLSEKLRDFSGAIAVAAAHAPNKYRAESYVTYENNMADLKQLWAEIRPQLKRDLDKAEWVDAKLQEAFAAFDAGENEKGCQAMWDLYNFGVKKLR